MTEYEKAWVENCRIPELIPQYCNANDCRYYRYCHRQLSLSDMGRTDHDTKGTSNNMP